MSNTPPTIQALSSQVGGHAGVLTTEDGSLIIKPVLSQELEFYQTLQQASEPAMQILREYTPKFIGTLRLEGQVDAAQGMEELVFQPLSEDHVEAQQKDRSFAISMPSIVLENLAYPFLRPNIMDVKLGTILYDSSAPEDKVARMEKIARETTSFETGIRLTGFQVYDNNTLQPVNTPKSYGKSIKPHQLQEGIAMFFPLGRPLVSATSTSAPTSGLPHEILLPVMRALREEISEIKDAYASLEIRMVGGSLLIAYESDWVRAGESIKKYFEEEEIVEEEEEEDSDDETNKIGPPFVVKLIDFAHTSFTPGQGPDESVLLGMSTVLRLLDARIYELTVVNSES